MRLSKSKLTLRQKKFADEYVKTGNAEQSALNAGYSERYARGNAHKLVANNGIKEVIDKRLKELESKQIADATEVLEYLTRVIRCEEMEITSEGIKIPPKVSDRTKAAELLSKRYGLGKDKLDIEEQQVNISKTKKNIETDVSAEDKLSSYFDKLGDVVDES